MKVISKEQAKKLQHKWQVNDEEFADLLKKKDVKVEGDKKESKKSK